MIPYYGRNFPFLKSKKLVPLKAVENNILSDNMQLKVMSSEFGLVKVSNERETEYRSGLYDARRPTCVVLRGNEVSFARGWSIWAI